MSNSNIDALSRFTAGDAGQQFLEQMQRHLLNKKIIEVGYSLTSEQVLVRVVVEGGMSIALAVPDVGPEWENNPPEFLDAFNVPAEDIHVMGVPGSRENPEEEESDGSKTPGDQG